ncbi:MAG: hypothetical protein NT085_00230 [candidate division SR1 bacterium]|nr:hypothetical protein [candidate division SR1 bacterium]
MTFIYDYQRYLSALLIKTYNEKDDDNDDDDEDEREEEEEDEEVLLIQRTGKIKSELYFHTTSSLPTKY